MEKPFRFLPVRLHEARAGLGARSERPRDSAPGQGAPCTEPQSQAPGREGFPSPTASRLQHAGPGSAVTPHTLSSASSATSAK